MQCAIAILSSVACPAPQYFSPLPRTWHSFLKKKIMEHKCVFWFPLQISCEKFLILRIAERDVTDGHRFLFKARVALVIFKWNLNFLYRFSKSTQEKVSWKFVQLEISCCMRTDGRTDRHDEADSGVSKIFESAYKLRSRRNKYLVKFWGYLPPLFQNAVPSCLLPIAPNINLSNPTDHVIHQQFNIQQLYALPTPYLCVLYLSENKQRLVLFISLTDWLL